MDNLFRRLFQPPKKLVSKFVSPGNIVADLGCGPGYYTVPMAKIVGSGGKVYAVDFDPKAIETLRGRIARRALEDIVEPHTGSASDVGFIKNESVDFAFANGLLCCMKDHNGAISEIVRILKPGGSAYLSVTKLFRKSDPRGVPEEEWHRYLENFKLLQSGEGITSRWALVSRKNDGSGMSRTDKRATGGCCNFLMKYSPGLICTKLISRRGTVRGIFEGSRECGCKYPILDSCFLLTWPICN